MKTAIITALCVLAMLLVLPAGGGNRAGAAGPQGAAPAVDQPLVREGAFAVNLHRVLGLGAVNDEAEAENDLGALGISPSNGWIADYPVTPDIMAELRSSVAEAVDSGKLLLAREEALRRFDGVATGYDLSVMPYTAGDGGAAVPDYATDYPDQAVIDDYYYDEGPPIVTYYTPPPDYYYLYAWVPFPFWCFDFWFPGFYVLRDFHRPFHYGGHLAFVSNHFNDFRSHRVYRVDPAQRFRGRTYAGIGAPRGGSFINTGGRGSPGSISNSTNRGNFTGGAVGNTATRGDRRTGAWGDRPAAPASVRSPGMTSGSTRFSGRPDAAGTFRRSGVNGQAPAVSVGGERQRGFSDGRVRTFTPSSEMGRYGYHSRSGGSAGSFPPPSGFSGRAASSPVFRSSPPSWSGSRSFSAPSVERSFSAPSAGRSFSAPSMGRSFSAPSAGRSFSAPSGGRSFSAPSGGRGFGGGRR